MLRFAPSPTGDMHIGNLRAAIFNYILAKQKNERFLLRIEDTDFARNIEGKDKEICSLLTLFGLQWDSLVYQSENFNHHRQFAEMLLKQGKAFYCYCSKEFLESKKQEAIDSKRAFRYDDAWAQLQKQEAIKNGKNPVVRLKGADKAICYTDNIKGRLEFLPNELDSFVILREDFVPTYNFACACDDMLYDISYVVRGEDHTSNTPKQLLIHKALGYEREIEFAHLPIILNDSGKKMSKRDCASSVAWLLDEGFLPSAICNYLIAMGNHTPKEIFTLEEAIEWFDIKKIAKSPVRFDIAKLRFINHAHLSLLDEEKIALLLESSKQYASQIGSLGKIYLEEASTLNELREKINAILEPKDIFARYEEQDFSAQCERLFYALQKLTKNPPKQYDEFKKLAMEESNLKGKEFFKPLRILLTGASHGPDISAMYPHLREILPYILRLKST